MSNDRHQGSGRLDPQRTLPYQDVKQFLQQLEDGLHGISYSIGVYERLIGLSPGDRETSELERLRQQESRLLPLIAGCLAELRGPRPGFDAEPAAFASYRDGLEEAIEVKRAAVRLYRDLYLLTPSQRVRDLCFLGLSDGVDQLAALLLLRQPLQSR